MLKELCDYRKLPGEFVINVSRQGIIFSRRDRVDTGSLFQVESGLIAVRSQDNEGRSAIISTVRPGGLIGLENVSFTAFERDAFALLPSMLKPLQIGEDISLRDVLSAQAKEIREEEAYHSLWEPFRSKISVRVSFALLDLIDDPQSDLCVVSQCQRVIGKRCGVSREFVNKQLSSFTDKDIIHLLRKKDKKVICIDNKDALLQEVFSVSSMAGEYCVSRMQECREGESNPHEG